MENIPDTPGPGPAPGGPRGHVLVVDDDPAVAEVVVGCPDRAGRPEPERPSVNR
ncbi:hypothetical protein ACWD6R_34270 [Streptomyces sp. NPDC005151]